MVGVAMQQRATTTKGQRFFVTVWFAVTVILVIATQVVNVPQALGDDGLEGEVNHAVDFSVTGVDLADERDPSVAYAGMVWAVTEARAVDAAEGLFERARVEVDVTLTNSLAATQVRVPDSIVTLVANDDGEAITARFVDLGSRLTVNPGEEVDVTIDFTIVDQQPKLGNYSLQIAEPNRVPASIPLDAEPRPHDYPVLAAVDTAPLRTADPDESSRQIVVEPVAASIDVNAGPYRAALDEELAVVKIDVQRTEADPDAGYLQLGYWALEVDGQRVPAILVAKSDGDATNTDEVTLLFAFPAQPDEITVVGGVGTGDEVTFSVVEPG